MADITWTDITATYAAVVSTLAACVSVIILYKHSKREENKEEPSVEVRHTWASNKM